jgi:hypothetical protein
MFVITRLTWQQADDRWWLSSVVFPDLTEQRRNKGVTTWRSSPMDLTGDPLDANEWQQGQ